MEQLSLPKTPTMPLLLPLVALRHQDQATPNAKAVLAEETMAKVPTAKAKEEEDVATIATVVP